MVRLDKRKVYIYTNDTDQSLDVAENLRAQLLMRKYHVTETCDESVGLIACIGGDGTYLHLMHDCGFPPSPVIGINTGHLGFFQEITQKDISSFLDIYEQQRYTLQNIWPIETVVCSDGKEYRHKGVNEAVIHGPHTHFTHLSIEIDHTLVQEFAGDGILISTSVGSTAYNYSLGGAIISPQLDALQLTPIAPANTNAYRCFRASIMYPSNLEVRVRPIMRTSSDTLEVVIDGMDYLYEHINWIKIHKSDQGLHLIRFNNYDYWTKLKDKLL